MSDTAIQIEPVANAGAPVDQHPPRRGNPAGTVIAAAGVLAICYFAELPLVVLFVSILLAYVLAPIAEVLMRAHLPRATASLSAVLLMMAAIFGIFYVTYNQAQSLMLDLPHYVREFRRIVARVELGAGEYSIGSAGVQPSAAASQPPEAPIHWLRLLTGSLGPITQVLFTASLIPFLAYFMLSWQEHVRAATVMLFRLENRHTAYVTLGLISAMLRSFLLGNLMIALMVSLASTVVFALLGLPYSYFLGFISGFVSLAPYLGIPLAILPPVIVGIGRLSSAGYAVIVAAVVGFHFIAMNVLYPQMLGRRLQLNPLAVTLSLLFWGWLWGAMGLILAIPITAALKIIFDHVQSLHPYGDWLGG